MISRYLLFFILIFISITREVYPCNTIPSIHPQLSLVPITRSISRMNSAIMRGSSLLKGEEYDEFEPVDNEPTPDDKSKVLFEGVGQAEIPEAEAEGTTIPSVTQIPINYTALKEELEMINKTKSLINLFEEKARKIYENGEKEGGMNKKEEEDHTSEYDLEYINETTTLPSNNMKQTTVEKDLYKGNDIKKMTEKEWEEERERQRLEEEKVIEERTKEFANERMMSEGKKINDPNLGQEESSGMEDTDLISSTSYEVTTQIPKIIRKKLEGTKNYQAPPHCNDAYVIAITNKPYNDLLVPLHRAEMSNELRHLENYVNRKLISWGQYTSYPMNYSGHFSQKYIMKNPTECGGLEKFTKKAVSYGIFMEAGIFQCKCGSVKTIAKVH